MQVAPPREEPVPDVREMYIRFEVPEEGAQADVRRYLTGLPPGATLWTTPELARALREPTPPAELAALAKALEG